MIFLVPCSLPEAILSSPRILHDAWEEFVSILFIKEVSNRFRLLQSPNTQSMLRFRNDALSSFQSSSPKGR